MFCMQSSIEPFWYSHWTTNNLFKAQEGTSGKRFSMVLPPPNVTGALHIGHALTVAVQDSLVRWRRMNGDETVWVPGLDHAGIATQAVVERYLANQNPPIFKSQLSREQFNEHVMTWKENYGGQINLQMVTSDDLFPWLNLICSEDWELVLIGLEKLSLWMKQGVKLLLSHLSDCLMLG
jgi:valyl-tRNA synthetase